MGSYSGNCDLYFCTKVKEESVVEKEDVLMQIIEAADRGEKVAEEYLSRMFHGKLLTSEKHNPIRRKIYRPKAETGDMEAACPLG